MWPQIPEDLNILSAIALRELAAAIHGVVGEQLARTDLAESDLDEVAAFQASRRKIVALAATKDRQAALAAEQAADDEAETAPPVVTEAAETTDEADEADAADEAKELATAGAKKVSTTFGSNAAREAKPASKGGKITPEYLLAKDGVAGKAAGDGFSSWAELAQAAVARSQSIRANTTENFAVAEIRGEYPEDRRLGDSASLNMSKFEPDEIQAAFCAPATPYYGLACMNTLRRPVFNSLPQFEAPRGQVSIMPSPSLSDITAGYGIWTDTDDDNANKTKGCATITCGSPTTFKMYGNWRCLTVKNLLAMTYPELVEAWLNRLGAAQARLAEQTMLQAMYAGAVDINAPALGYGGTTSILSTILNYLGLYQETQRWDITGNMRAWAPRWVLYGIKMDLLRRSQDGSNVPRVATDAEVEAMFANVGVDITWFIDTPSWAVAIPGVGASNLNLLPASVQILIAPPGKFAAIDRGNLTIGVTGNNIYRDNASNARNQFTFFFESFEGVVNTTSCPAHVLDIPAHWNGVQIAEIVINAQGGDEVGYQS